MPSHQTSQEVIRAYFIGDSKFNVNKKRKKEKHLGTGTGSNPDSHTRDIQYKTPIQESLTAANDLGSEFTTSQTKIDLISHSNPSTVYCNMSSAGTQL